MFGQREACVRVIKGRTRDAPGLRAAADRWSRDVAPKARGWLGTTGGVTDDGVYVEVVRFSSVRAARRHDRRKAQVRWWDEVRGLLEGEVSVAESTDVETFIGADVRVAGFVQVLQTRVRDREAVRPFLHPEAERTLARLRPDMVGLLFCVHPGGLCTGVGYFTSMEAARRGERTRMPAAYHAWRDEQMAHFEGDPDFYDLRDCWVRTP